MLQDTGMNYDGVQVSEFLFFHLPEHHECISLPPCFLSVRIQETTENSETRGVRSVQAEQAGLNTHAFGRINCPRPGSSLGSSGQTALVPQSVSWAVARMVLFARFCLFCMCVGCACCVHKQVCVRVLACGDLRLTSGPSVTLHLVTEAGSPGEPSLLQGSAVSAFQPPSSGITGRLPPPPGPRACVAST